MNATTAAPATVTLAGRVFRTKQVAGVLNLLDACGRCSGRGEVNFGGVVFNGHRTCFACAGSGGTWFTYDAMVAKLARAEKAEAARVRKAERAAAAARTELDIWLAAQDETVVAGIRAAEWGLLLEFADTIKFRPLTERQMTVAAKIVAEQAVKAAARAVTDATARTVGHLAPVGDKVNVAVEVRTVKEFDGDYGVRYLVTMVTAEGHVLKTWSSGEFGRNAEAGDKVTIKATVKKHDEYNGTPQTELTRVKAA